MCMCVCVCVCVCVCGVGDLGDRGGAGGWSLLKGNHSWFHMVTRL